MMEYYWASLLDLKKVVGMEDSKVHKVVVGKV
jgi:hypothetical protein